MIKELFIKSLPSSLVGFMARPYIGGYSLKAALDRSMELLKEEEILSTIDLLGEEVNSRDKARQNRNLYLQLLRSIKDRDWGGDKSLPTVSLKLSSLTTVEDQPDKVEIDEEFLDENLTEIFDYSRDHNIDLTIDMEDYRWTTLTLDVYQRFLDKGYENIGTVLQTRLHRTEEDIERLDERARIRLCIGIYPESEEIALTDKALMKNKIVEFGKKLLDKGVYTEFATHDLPCLERVFDEVIIPGNYGKEDFEVQMLLGVPREEAQKEIVKGSFRSQVEPVKVRLYVPFAENKKDAVAYCKRRLINNPSIMTYGLRNIFIRK